MSASREFPPQKGPYHVQVKNGAGWHGHDTARLQISVGQAYHEGDKLRAQAEWIRHRFRRAVVCVNDGLQRHNLMFASMTEPQAMIRCVDEGGKWIARNREALKVLPNAEVYQWHHWTRAPGFEAEHRRVQSLYANDPAFRAAVDEEVEKFWQRQPKEDGLCASYRFDAFKFHSVNYLLEETAAFFLMFEKDRAVDIYPGSTLLPCALAKAYAQKGGDTVHFTRIDFKRRDARRLEAA